MFDDDDGGITLAIGFASSMNISGECRCSLFHSQP